MNYFGFTLYISDITDISSLILYLSTELILVTTPRTSFEHIAYNVKSSFPHLIKVEGLRADQYKFLRIYSLLRKYRTRLLGKVCIEYQHPTFANDPYYSLVFDTSGVNLASDANFESTGDVVIVKKNYSIPQLFWKQFLIK